MLGVGINDFFDFSLPFLVGDPDYSFDGSGIGAGT
jgi:hypothetical protein